MRKLTIRKAYKTSCELKEATVGAKTALGVQTRFEVNGGLGTMEELIADLHRSQDEEIHRQLAALKLVGSIRARIQAANNRPLAYADGVTINELIQSQATIKMLLTFYPEDSAVSVTKVRDLELTAERTRNTLNDTTNTYRSSTNPIMAISGTSEEIKERLSAERLVLRVMLESVTGQLAYANITETVELSDDEAQILGSFRIPV